MHLFENDSLSDFFKTCLECSPGDLAVHARISFRSVDKYGHHQPSWIFPVIASASYVFQRMLLQQMS